MTPNLAHVFATTFSLGDCKWLLGESVPPAPVSRQGLAMVRIDQAGKGLRIALLAHMPIGSPGKLPPRRLATGA